MQGILWLDLEVVYACLWPGHSHLFPPHYRCSRERQCLCVLREGNGIAMVLDMRAWINRIKINWDLVRKENS